MTNYERILDAMLNKLPEEQSFIDRHIHYTSTQKAHYALANYITGSIEGTTLHKFYVIKSYEWLVLLKSNNIKLHNIIK